MKESEVPQDQDPSFEGGKKLCYAVDENGRFVSVKTSGWNVEAEAKDIAWKVIHADLEKTKIRIKVGKASPLEYFMKYRQMDIDLLSQNLGVSFLRVWWHLRPTQFSKLSEKWLQRYSECLTIPIESLRNFKGE